MMSKKEIFRGKTILITGGTGSFGNAVLEYLLNTEIKEIRIFSRDEKKQDDMRKKFSDERIKFHIGDVRDISSINVAIVDVDYLFHAAALKQVPTCEFFPMEAVRTNILGTENVLNSAIDNGVKKVVVLSTDKAVYPINAMGLTKALLEKIMIARSRSIKEKGTVLCGTRYGNVMASRGSVIPFFIDQILDGKPLTVTDPKMTRFLMSLDDSIGLVLHAFEHGQQGDMFVQKSPAATIGDLAKALVELFECNNEIKIIGTRHGEKLHETLVSREEMSKVVDLGDYYRIPADNRDLNYNKYFSEGKEITSFNGYSSDNTERLDVEGIKNLLMSLEEVRNSVEEFKKKK